MKPISLILFVFAFNISMSSFSQEKSNDSKINQETTIINDIKAPPPSDPILIFSYDTAGNQVQRFYCGSGNSCTIPNPPQNVPEDSETENIANNKKPQITLYPNPANNQVTVGLYSIDTSLSIESITIYNVKGNLIKSIPKGHYENSIDILISTFPSGIYYVHIHLNDSSSNTLQLIKR